MKARKQWNKTEEKKRFKPKHINNYTINVNSLNTQIKRQRLAEQVK